MDRCLTESDLITLHAEGGHAGSVTQHREHLSQCPDCRRREAEFLQTQQKTGQALRGAAANAMKTASEALGARRMRAGCKDEVIEYLRASDLPAPMRRRWYREWCGATLTKVRIEDLHRVAPPAPREEQLELFPDRLGLSHE